MKSPSGDAARHERLQQERRHILADIAGLAEQVSSGEIDEATAERLRAGYRAELGAIEAEVGGLPAAEPEAPTEPVVTDLGEQVETGDGEEPPPVEDRRSLRGAVVGSLALVAVITVAILWIANAAFPDPEPTDAAPGPVLAGDDLGTIDAGQLVDLTTDELEAVVAAHPDSVSVRLLLADRYLEAGEDKLALEHYLLVTTSNPTAAEESRATGRIGYLAYATGQREAARDFLDEAVALDPANGEAKLFLGMVLLYGFDDVTGAVPLLEDVAALPDLPDAVRAQVATALQEAQARGGG